MTRTAVGLVTAIILALPSLSTGPAATTGSTCPDLAYEPDTIDTASPVAVSATMRRGFCTPSDLDWVTFEATSGTTYELTTFNLATDVPVDTRLELYSDPATVVATNDDFNGRASRIVYTAERTGTHYLRIEQFDGAGGDAYSYELRVALGEPGNEPQILNQVPRRDQTDVSRTGNISVLFDDDVLGVDKRTFLVTKAGSSSPIKARITRTGSSSSQWVLDPDSSLSSDTRYAVTLIGGRNAIRDTGGTPLPSTSWTFTTGPAPTVRAHAPSSGAKGVSRSTELTVTFSEAVVDVGVATFTLTDTRTDDPVPATVTRNGTTNRWTLDPSVTLAASTRYTARVTGGPTAVRDVVGNPLRSTSWSFTTRR